MRGERRLIVTGASTGIGRALVEGALQEGWRVLASVRNADDRRALEALGCDAEFLDLRDEQSVAAFCAAAVEWAGGVLHGLANNAGAALAGPVERLSGADLREQFAVNVFGHVQLTGSLLPALRAGAGCALFVSSDRAPTAVPVYGAYVASKRALEGFAEVLAMECADSGVRIAVLRLGSFQSAIRGPIAEQLARLDPADPIYGGLVSRARALLGSPPLHPPEEAARCGLALLSDPAPPLFTACPSCVGNQANR